MSLPDVQNTEDTRGIAIERVGVTGVKFPIRIAVKPTEIIPEGESREVSATINLFVGLPSHYKGANLSRFVRTLVDFNHDGMVVKEMEKLLEMLCTSLVSEDAYARMEFDYYVEREAPVSKLKAPQAYRCAFTGIKKKDQPMVFITEVNVIAASLCPCSREMSLLRNLGNIITEKDTAVIIGEDGPPALVGKGLLDAVGMGAHNQRSLIRVQLITKENEIFWLEDLIALTESAASAPVFPILKREDEKFVTELAYNNSKFSEDITRDLQKLIEANSIVESWSIKVENQESIHPYNVTCYQKSDNWKH